MGGGGGNRGILNLPLPPVTQGEEGSSEEGEKGGKKQAESSSFKSGGAAATPGAPVEPQPRSHLNARLLRRSALYYLCRQDFSLFFIIDLTRAH